MISRLGQLEAWFGGFVAEDGLALLILGFARL